MPNVYISDEAHADIAGIIARIEPDNFDAALRINEAINAAFELLAERPGFGTLVEIGEPVKKPFRFWPLRKYKQYLVVYQPCQDGIEVVRVIHGALDLYRLRF